MGGVMEGWGQHRGRVLERSRGWGHNMGWSQGVGGTGLGRGVGPAQRPCTHPIEAAQVLDPVLVPVSVVVDDSVLLVHTAGLGRHTNSRVADRARRPRRWRHPRRPCSPLSNPPPPDHNTTTRPLATQPMRSHPRLHTSSVCAPEGPPRPDPASHPGHGAGRGVPPAPACLPGPSRCDQPSTAPGGQCPPAIPATAPGSAWEGLGMLGRSGTRCSLPRAGQAGRGRQDQRADPSPHQPSPQRTPLGVTDTRTHA